MFTIIKKEINQFFNAFTGYIAIAVFLLLCGLLLFVIPANNVLDFNIINSGYASLENFFKLAPWILLLLIPAITMRLFADEFKIGTYETLKTKPLTNWQIILGKYFGAFAIVAIALLPTIIYVVAVKSLSYEASIDTGNVIGSYIGLFFLAGVFIAIGLCCSSFTSNAVSAFIVSTLLCLAVFFFFTAFSKLPFFKAGFDYYVESFGLDFHYRSISRGVIDTRDIVYFCTTIFLFLAITFKNLLKK
jgi:ABC-2 type transport system permease protein